MIFDTHAHYDDAKFDEDRYALLSSMQEKGITNIVNVACDLASCKTSLELAEQYPFIYAAVGVHPSEVGDLQDSALEVIQKLTSHKKVVAIGEIGLDYYWEKNQEAREKQRLWFARQLILARTLKLPVIIHSRDAAEMTLKMLEADYKQNFPKNPGVVHCFSYSAQHAMAYVKMGYFIGVGGVVTYNNARVLKEVVKAIPIESIVLETDCPYLAPVPRRGSRNSSVNLPFVAQAIANLKEMDIETVIRITDANAKRLYGLK